MAIKKKAAGKIVKKITKKAPAKKRLKRVVAKAPAAAKALAGKPAIKPIGIVTHYFAKIKVAIIKCKQPVSVGETIGFRGATTEFDHKIISMQYDHQPVAVGKKGQELGVKVAKRVRDGDEVFLIK